MYSKNVTITNPTGLHARPASQFVQTAAKFASEILLVKNGNEINAKSIMGVMAGGLSQGTEIEIRANGADEQEAVDTLAALIENGFGE
ncbi:HPr family phosphocarrier protein [Anaerofustis stercorihominis]|uniref:Phosphocarrier protein HPr n=2 Tax=Anaerofustis stercorihominis TaxID=214853 RepID=B1CB17_9FIRM|nr:HPr family phosphocarrier protein [Anaerofustis stercorihominis]EDS71464.1 phosphocarrier, HPr family [Anaerofustis stercorihominis DSM 17244]MCQ4795417.1 HPr family phosphocarrier protein [Anaerofustis stercorihominis]MCR2033119.1 HPr family phosphocarrier protein [Anaerofustis stercorihominis]RGD73333.1 HPr family phosphocarrier protein [Anaerofustis stercorihominis]